MGKTKLERERDRVTRLMFLQHLLYANKQGLTVPAMASHCEVSTRTIHRDLQALDALGVKTYKEDNRYVLLPGRLLPPVKFTQPEAIAIFMAARLLLQHSSVYNHDIETAFTKVGAVVPDSLRDDIMKTLEWMRHRRADPTLQKTLNIVSSGWLNRKQVHIRYLPLNATASDSRIIETYFIQPSAIARAVYIIARCRLRNSLRIFRLDRIIEATALDNPYEIPEEFDANEYLSGYWSVTATGTPRTVRLRFCPEVARIATETFWHDSQVTEAAMDGSAVVSMHLAITQDLVSFVLGWAEMVEVLEPAALKREVLKAAHKVAVMYRGEQPEYETPSSDSIAKADAAVETTDEQDSSAEAFQLELFPPHIGQLE